MSTTTVNFEPNLVFGTRLLNDIANSYKESTIDIVRFLSDKYEFDFNDAVTSLNLDNLTVVNKKNPAAAAKRSPKPKPEVVPVPKYPKPWTGDVDQSNCSAIVPNHGLYTQCIQKPENGSPYCAKCNGKILNNGNEPPYGNVDDRMKVHPKQYCKNKAKPPLSLMYVIRSTVGQNKYGDPTVDEIKAEFAKFGINLSEDHY